MSVIVRCPNCGTTRAAPGECDACHDAQARYFCTNHAPGLWLDGSTCPKCGARFGATARAASVPAPGTPARARPATPPPAHPRASISVAPARRPESPALPLEVVAERSERSPVVREEELEDGPSGVAPWQTILGAVLRARAAAPDRERLLIGAGAGGCLRRVVITVLLLGLGLVIALFLFGRALMHSLQPY